MLQKVMLCICLLLSQLVSVNAFTEWKTDERCRRLDKAVHATRTDYDYDEERDLSPETLLSNITTGDAEGRSKTILSRQRLRGSRSLLDSEDLAFNLKLYWEEEYCWQGEWDDREWCMECEGRTCEVGATLILSACSPTEAQRFQWVPDHTFSEDSIGQLKLVHYDLCLERTSVNHFTLAACSGTTRTQLLVGLDRTKQFQLHPIDHTGKCINQHHHPKGGEEILSTHCDLAERWNTDSWQLFMPDDGGPDSLKTQSRQCTEARPCDRCRGDCDSDEQCSGDLKCFQRTRYDKVPGCIGWGASGRDYCYRADLKDTIEPTLVPSTGPQSSISESLSPSKTSIGVLLSSEHDRTVPLAILGVEESLLAPTETPSDRSILTSHPTTTLPSHIISPLPTKIPTSEPSSITSVPTNLSTLEPMTLTEPTPVPSAAPLALPPTHSANSALFPITSKPSLTSDFDEISDTLYPLAIRSSFCTTVNPCGVCEGDCNADRHCEGNLSCYFQRGDEFDGFEVPGCYGLARFGVFYCYKP